MSSGRGKRSSRGINSDNVCRMDDCQVILFFTGIIFAEIEIEASVQNSCVSFPVQSKPSTR
jgi:hypothetical protein